MSASKCTLPVEVWQEIFICSRQFRDPFERMDFPLTLLSVCTTWRSIVFQTSALWSTIVLNHIVTRCPAIRPNDLEKRSEEFDVAKFFLQNSRQSQLSIYIQLTTSNRDKPSNPSLCCRSTPALLGESKSSVHSLASLLAPHASRFRRFHVLSTRYSPVRELLSAFPQVVMPCLEELHIDRVQKSCSQLHFDCPITCLESLAFLNIDHLMNNDSQEHFHDNFPALKSVALTSVPLLLPVFTPRHLTSLKMTLPHLNFTGDLRNLLTANSHCLERLSFMTTHSLNPFQARGPLGSMSSEELVIFPLVTTLSISYVDPDTFHALLSFLRFPSVTSLRVANVQRAQLHSTRHFFNGLFDCLPFRQVEELDLENIFTNNAHPHRSPSDHISPTQSPSPHHPYDVLAYATSVKVLTLTNVDQRILFYLNNPSALIRQNGGMQMSVPLLCLMRLRLAPTGDPADLNNVLWFLRDRQRRYRDFSVLQELKISGPSMWAYDLAGVDMRNVAKRVQLLSPSLRSRSGGIWDEDIPCQFVVDLSPPM